ncbi:hypothetical protein NAEGRDRAFT_80794 [Naegleria gruberi]|uniref:START domain-containing protein n=1 Tax=Naegleria gruberi TaxID=5762 RepID=D2VPW0_NAEGR|nr:uncharacterized protein NAEGRDRAFT_80794 [Naegleria gruberi]EFC41274.1 hypothetical protein NAEGRDRAFT_80794 [Naegleria gruberi]|eukprot:XP_002674018.1 hypothetical protein NAEGRDRAFT_80794 [Naegleria gruberi strain NEG-M]
MFSIESINKVISSTLYSKALSVAQHYEKSTDLFKPYKVVDQVTISVASANEGSVIRGETLISQCTVDEIVPLLTTADTKTRQIFDENTKSITEVGKFSTEEGNWSVRHYVVTSPSMMVSERDFLYVERYFDVKPEVSDAKKTTILLTTSIDEALDIKPAKGHVRGTNIFTYLKFTELNNGDLRATFIAQAAPNGYIPTAIANSVVYVRPLLLSLSAKQLGKNCTAC